MDPVLQTRLLEELEKLPYELQRRVLDFAQALALSRPKGVPGRELLRFSGAISLGDLREMSQAIDEGCERVDPSEW